jgi:hypothetical protein
MHIIIRKNRYWYVIAALVAVAFTALIGRSLSGSAGGSRAPTAAEYSASVLTSTSPFQREILQDGVVTFAELESAKQATIACARDAGLTVEVKPTAGLRPSSYGLSAPTEAELDVAVARLAECEREFISDVEMTRAYAGYTPAELAVGLSALNACLRADGGPALPELRSMADVGAVFGGTPDETNLREWGKNMYRYSRCKATVEEQTGFRFS